MFPFHPQNITNFGCFVALDGFRKKSEGLVHISQLRREGRVNRVEEVVNRGQAVKVKVSEEGRRLGKRRDISKQGGKTRKTHTGDNESLCPLW